MRNEMSEQHAGLLKTLAGIDEADELHPKLVDAYWELKRCFDRLNCNVTDRELAMLAFTQGLGKPLTGEDSLLLGELFKKGVVKHGAPIEVQFRNVWRSAKLIGPTGTSRMFVVQIDGDSEERTINDNKIRLPELVPA